MKENQYDRQSFLGENSQEIIENTVVGVIGTGGGGSHICQQLAHVGFRNFVVFDPDIIETTNLNRLVGGSPEDVADKRLKVDIAERTIKKIQPLAAVQKFASRWQDNPSAFRSCDLIFGCLDGYAARQEIEASARRYLIPLIDIGMDVYKSDDGKYSISGQIILSLPEQPCMTCLGFLNDDKLAREAALYGDAGTNPQVIWSNGVLASTAVGVAVELLTNWIGAKMPPLYLTYDGNRGIVQPHPAMKFLNNICPHFPAENVGDPVFKTL
jgi:hypothetical protein